MGQLPLLRDTTFKFFCVDRVSYGRYVYFFVVVVFRCRSGAPPGLDPRSLPTAAPAGSTRSTTIEMRCRTLTCCVRRNGAAAMRHTARLRNRIEAS